MAVQKKGGFTAICGDRLFPWVAVEGGKHAGKHGVFHCGEINAGILKLRFHYC